MANDKDKLFEKIYFLWKGEGEKRNQSIDWYCERYHADVEEFRKWYQGINHSVKEVQVVGRPGQPEAPKQEAETAEEAMRRLREQQESEARIVVTTSPEEQMRMFLELAESRSTEHTGGRKRLRG